VGRPAPPKFARYIEVSCGKGLQRLGRILGLLQERIEDGPPPCEMFSFRKMEGATAQLNAQRWSQDDHNSDANAGMKQIEQKIFAVYVVDVALIRISPPRRPRVYDVEPVAAILEALLAFDNSGLMDNKSVLAPEIGAELVIRNVAAFLRVLS